MIRLYYVNKNTNVITTSNGFEEVVDVDDFYKDVYIRNVYVVKVDLFLYLTEIFSEHTLKNYREILYYIFSGSVKDLNKCTNAILYLYSNDKIFKRYFNSILLFKNEEYLNMNNFDTLMNIIKDSIELIKVKIERLVSYTKILFLSKGYLYFSIKKELLKDVSNIKGMEVLSR